MRYVHLTRGKKKAIPFILPGALVVALLILYPLFYIISVSFGTNAMGKGEFAGLTNYIHLLKNPLLSQTIFNTMRWTPRMIAASFLIGCVLAIMINYKGIMAEGFLRSFILIVWIVPGVVKAMAWKWPFATDGGMANHLLLSLGVIKKAIPQLISLKYAMMSTIIVQIWTCAPYVMPVIAAGISRLPTGLYEGASPDDVNWLQKLSYIAMPLLKDINFICILMLLVWAINELSLIQIVTNGGQNTGTFSLLVYNQLKVLNPNPTSASAVVQLLIATIFTILYVKFMIKENWDS